ncbi:hypothetical protein [Streptomyces sp. CB03911]|uniref:hypothetical protein n=1 Tax=Streptomycetaceae TaxID=2062 RepID=UPI00093AD7B4|nr:hypothetical protein [Streptomyces sp. CB03911]OKI13279.1 hypothetical protein A6A07_15350 [Streptomyces sp. CB03911]
MSLDDEMNDFADALMVRYLRPDRVDALLVPTDDPDRTRVRLLLAAVYEPRFLEVRVVDSVQVVHKEFQTAVRDSITVRGFWEQLLPTTEQYRGSVELPAGAVAQWVDMSLETEIEARLAATGSVLESVDSEEDDRPSTPALAGRTPSAATAATWELPTHFKRLYRLHYTEPSPFDPSAPARTFRLRVSVLFFGRRDLVGALRRLHRARRALDAASPQPDTYDGGALLASSAWLAVFPAALPAQDTPQATDQQVSDLLAAQGFVAAFEAAP